MFRRFLWLKNISISLEGGIAKHIEAQSKACRCFQPIEGISHDGPIPIQIGLEKVFIQR